MKTCRHRSPARGAIDRGQPRRHIADRLPVGKLSHVQHCPRLHSPEFRARVDAGFRALRAFAGDCSVVTAGDLV